MQEHRTSIAINRGEPGFDNQQPQFSPMPVNAAAAEDKIEAAASNAYGDTDDDQVGSEESSSTSSSYDDSSSSGDGESTPLRCTLVHPEYVDCSGIPDDATQEEVDISIQSARLGVDPNDLSAVGLDGEPGIVRKSSCNKATFPAALFDILADPELDDIIAWLPHGRSWRIVDVDKFNEQVLSSYFNQSKYTSFIRQVNGWGFRRVQNGPEANTYYHELFLRGKVSINLLCYRMMYVWVVFLAIALSLSNLSFHRMTHDHTTESRSRFRLAVQPPQVHEETTSECNEFPRYELGKESQGERRM